MQARYTTLRTARKTQLPVCAPKIDVFKLWHKMTVGTPKFQIFDPSSSSFIAIMRIRNRDDGSRMDCFSSSQLQMVRWTIIFPKNYYYRKLPCEIWTSNSSTRRSTNFYKFALWNFNFHRIIEMMMRHDDHSFRVSITKKKQKLVFDESWSKIFADTKH